MIGHSRGSSRSGLGEWLTLGVLGSCFVFGGWLFAGAQIPEQYPAPLVHTPANHPAEHVLIVTVDGMHAVDLANWVGAHPQSALAGLSRRGVSYTNAHVPWPDGAAGLLALATGGTSISTGILSSEGYDRALSSGGMGCVAGGAEMHLDGAGAPLPRDPQHGCAEVPVHALVRVNSIFDLVHANGGRTAWADESPAYADLLRGPSGTALDDVFVPPEGSGAKSLIEAARVGDERRVDAVLGWIDGGIDGRQGAVPRLFGVALMSLDAAQRTARSGLRTGTRVEAPLQSAFEQVDGQLGRIVRELRKTGLEDSTWIVVTARHGQAPMADEPLRVVDPARVEGIARSAAHGELARVTADTVGLVWLKHPETAGAVVQAYRENRAALGIGEIYSADKLALIMNTAEQDTRMPDIVLEPQPGVIWMRPGGDRPRVHGGFSDEQNHVALLISGRQLTGRVDKTPVPTTQIAPLILRILGMEKTDLNALHREHTPALPGIF